LIFVNGEGDYWIEVGKVGYNKRRFEIRRVSEEQVMLADARLTSAIVSLDAVNVTADNRALVNRGSATKADVGGGDKSLSTNSAAVPPNQAGNLAAAAATIPGIQLIPGTDAGADSSGQKSTTLRMGGNLRGPLALDKAFYNASYSVQRNFADMLTLLNTSPLGLQSAGVSADSAGRLIGILGVKGISVEV